MATRLRGIAQALGPGILFAGAAIGVSHLVQATRMGAVFGLWPLVVIFFAHAAKYPAMVFGPRYAAATGQSLIEAYRDQGRWPLAVFALIAVGTSFTILAAVTLVCASVLRTALGLPSVSLVWISLACLAISALIMGRGGFRWLDGVLKVMMIALLLATLLAAALLLPRMDFQRLLTLPPALGLAAVVPMVALIGWMPAPLDITTWHSLWTLDRAEQTRHTPTSQQCKLDFHIGYLICFVTACCFLLLGAVVLYQPGIAPESQAAPFIEQLFGLYEAALGEWVRPLIALTASAVMLSTTITVFDALPRAAEAIITTATHRPRPRKRTRLYWAAAIVFSTGALAIIASAGETLAPLVQLAMVLSFLGTPMLAWFNHRAMHSARVPHEHRPSRPLRILSLTSIVFWWIFAGVYLLQLLGIFES